MMDETPSPPDDAPVTWGELREVFRAAAQYQNAVLLWSIQGLTAAIVRDETKPAREAALKETEELVRAKAEQFLAKVPGALDE